MKKKKVGVLLLPVLLLIFFSTIFSKESISKSQSDEIINKIRQLYKPYYKKYTGIKSIRRVKTDIIDPDTGEIKEKTEVLLVRKDFFYEEPEIIVKEFYKNDHKTDISEFDIKKGEPTYPMFDSKGKDRYEFKVIGTKKVKGVECYQIKVTPKDDTDRHFKGTIYHDVKKLYMVYIEGGIADYPFGLKDLKMKFYMIEKKVFPMISSGELMIRIYVPIVFPDTRIESKIKVLQSEMIKK